MFIAFTAAQHLRLWALHATPEHPGQRTCSAACVSWALCRSALRSLCSSWCFCCASRMRASASRASAAQCTHAPSRLLCKGFSNASLAPGARAAALF